MSNAALMLLGLAVAFIVAGMQLNLTPFDWWKSTPRFMAGNTLSGCAVMIVAAGISHRAIPGVLLPTLELAFCLNLTVTIRGVTRRMRGR